MIVSRGVRLHMLCNYANYNNVANLVQGKKREERKQVRYSVCSPEGPPEGHWEFIADEGINDLRVATDIYDPNLVKQITKCWHIKRAIAAHELSLIVRYKLLF